MRWYGWMLIVTGALAIAYLGLVFASRHAASQPRKPLVDPAIARRQAELDRIYGGTELKIIHFYPASAELAEGDHTVVCYGVLNAVSVRIDPPVDWVGVSLNRCLEVAPKRDTQFTLFATGRDGSVLSQSLVIRVHKASPKY